MGISPMNDGCGCVLKMGVYPKHNIEENKDSTVAYFPTNPDVFGNFRNVGPLRMANTQKSLGSKSCF